MRAEFHLAALVSGPRCMLHGCHMSYWDTLGIEKLTKCHHEKDLLTSTGNPDIHSKLNIVTSVFFPKKVSGKKTVFMGFVTKLFT